jgi:hypothetical protein
MREEDKKERLERQYLLFTQATSPRPCFLEPDVLSLSNLTSFPSRNPTLPPSLTSVDYLAD